MLLILDSTTSPLHGALSPFMSLECRVYRHTTLASRGYGHSVISIPHHQWGGERQSQTLEMAYAGYEWVAIKGAFLIHRGFKERLGDLAHSEQKVGF
jgi:hypothetical protein